MTRTLPWIVATSFVVVACAANDEVDFLSETGLPDEDAGTTGVVLPPPASPDAGSPVDAGKDSGKDSGKVDAGKDAGVAAPDPGDTCTTQDALATRMCGKCGKQQAICQPSDGGLVWSEYGPCAGEAGECLPGETRACGNCGTQTCNNYCGWAACGGQPSQSCSPGSVDFTTAGCPTGGFKSRTCASTCQWETYSLACETPKAVNVWSGAYAHSNFMKGNDGKIYAWGLDAKGQLGDSDTANKSKLVPTPLSNVVSMAAGGGTTYGFACAAFADGSAKCWGNISTSYTLGDGTTSVSPTPITPTGFDADVVSVTAGYAHGCALFNDGTAKCWGYNTYGQLGNGTKTTSKTPVLVDLTGISELASGYETVCARADDAAYCWGYNTYGAVGDGTTTSRETPTLTIASGVARVSSGYYHSCAVLTDGSAKCWGRNSDGRIGNGNTTDSKTPATVVGIDGVGAKLENVAEICNGYAHTCARLTDGRVACWGSNDAGQQGTGVASNVPKVVPGITGAKRLVCGYNHVCVVDGDALPKCWGDNAYGQVGDGSMPTDATSPQATTF